MFNLFFYPAAASTASVDEDIFAILAVQHPVALAFAAAFLIFACLAAAFVFVAAEFAVLSVDRERVRFLVDNPKEPGHKAAVRLLPHIKDNFTMDHCVAACQIIITISSLILGFVGEAMIAPFIRGDLARLLGYANPADASHVIRIILVAFFTCLQVVLCELVPKSIATRRTEAFALALIGPVDITIKCSERFIRMLNGSGTAILKFMGFDTSIQHSHSRSLSGLINMVNSSKSIDPEAGKRVTSALYFPALKVSDIFYSPLLEKAEAEKIDSESDPAVRIVLHDGPLSPESEPEPVPATEADMEKSRDISFRVMPKKRDTADTLKAAADPASMRHLVYLGLEFSIKKVLDIFGTSPYSRLPIYGSGIDSGHIVGIVHIKDVSCAYAEDLFGQAKREKGCSSLEDITLEEFGAFCDRLESGRRNEILADRDLRIKRAQEEAERRRRKGGAGLGSIERACKLEIRRAVKEANDKINSELRFPHGFIKRSAFVLCRPDDKLDEVRENLNKERSFMAVVEDSDHRVLGILTLEDIFESILGYSITDEADSEATGRRQPKKSSRKTIAAQPDDVWKAETVK